MSAMGSQITSLMIVYSTVYSGADKRKHQKFTLSWYERNFARQVLKLPKESKLYAEINNERSACVVIEAGVSHGFILGSLLFLMYTSDIPNVGRAIRFILCAIDSNGLK